MDSSADVWIWTTITHTPPPPKKYIDKGPTYEIEDDSKNCQ